MHRKCYLLENTGQSCESANTTPRQRCSLSGLRHNPEAGGKKKGALLRSAPKKRLQIGPSGDLEESKDELELPEHFVFVVA
jgi:hypothetical protein